MNELQVVEQQMMPTMDISTAVERFNLLGQFVSTIMKRDIDFGVIPGTQKPTLLKPGAEKLTTFFGLTKVVMVVEREEDWTGINHGGEPFFYYWYRVALYKGEIKIAEADGSCNSWEGKYRFRQAERVCPKCHKETIRKSKQSGWYCWAKIGGCGAQFKDGDQSVEKQDLGKVKNPNPADLVNTIQKMALKRALVAAALIGVNASEYFTQDVEDFQAMDMPFKEESAHEPPKETDAPKGKGKGQQRSSPDGAYNASSPENKTSSDSPKTIPLAERIAKALTACGSIGYHVADMEAWLKKPSSEWDEADLDKLGKWYKEELAQIKTHEQEAAQEAQGGKDA